MADVRFCAFVRERKYTDLVCTENPCPLHGRVEQRPLFIENSFPISGVRWQRNFEKSGAQH
jgi:hypothetical protein